jgi:protein ImuA
VIPDDVMDAAALTDVVGTRTSSSCIPASVWRADQLARAAGRTQPSRHATLDAHLPGGGWPLAALTELLLPHAGVGELQLVSPAIAACMSDSRQALLIGSPHRLYGPALPALHWHLQQLLLIEADDNADRLWAAEQALKCPAIGALMVWLPRVRVDQLRRLHLAAMASETLVFVLRPLASRDESSPAPLRIACQATFDGNTSDRRHLELDIVKRRGPVLDQSIRIEFELPVSLRPSARGNSVEIKSADHALDSTRLHSAADRSAYVH